MQEDNELDILSGCKKGDRKSQEMLYNFYAKKMYNVCLGYTFDKDQAQDLLQDGFIKVFKHIKSFKNEGSLEGWIRRIMINNALDHIKCNKKNQIFTDLDEEYFDNKNYTNKNEGVVKMDHMDFFTLIKDLPQGYRIILNLYFIEGYNHQEIAKKLNINIGTSKSQLYKAKKLLKKQLTSVPKELEYSLAI